MLLLLALACGAVAHYSPTPTVDLGTSIHQGVLDTVNNYYRFENIRYGQAPVGNLRFAPPIAPTGRNTAINNGSNNVVMPAQATPTWVPNAISFMSAYLQGQNISSYTTLPSSPATSPPLNLSSIPKPDPNTSEDCLFLDVYVPPSIFSKKTSTTGAAVLVEIYGGGFTSGDKQTQGLGYPSGLLARSLIDDKEGAIYVTMNYRLGLFGWLAGSPDVTANVGLLDQRLALEWVKENIHLFGGDPKRVTVIGESAGAGSIIHHITSYGGKGSVPFQQAIAQSPGFHPQTPSQDLEVFNYVLSNATLVTGRPITNVDELRKLTFIQLYQVNYLIVSISTYGLFTFGPAVDTNPGSYVPDFPGRLLAEGKFHDVKVLAAHNSDEGLLFTPPWAQTQTAFQSYLLARFPSLNVDQVSSLTTKAYPQISNGTTDAITRTATMIADGEFTCNAYWLRKYPTNTWGYEFTVPPATHGFDILYTFYNGSGVQYPDVAVGMQDLIVGFAMNGAPGNVTRYHSNGGEVSVISPTNFGEEVEDPANRSQCEFWRDAPYYVQ